MHVVGVPDQRMGEELCAWVKKSKGNEELTENDVKTFCKDKVKQNIFWKTISLMFDLFIQIAHFKIPRYILFVDSYPTTVSGKVQKFKIREETKKLLKL